MNNRRCMICGQLVSRNMICARCSRTNSFYVNIMDFLTFNDYETPATVSFHLDIPYRNAYYDINRLIKKDQLEYKIVQLNRENKKVLRLKEVVE